VLISEKDKEKLYYQLTKLIPGLNMGGNLCVKKKKIVQLRKVPQNNKNFDKKKVPLPPREQIN